MPTTTISAKNYSNTKLADGRTVRLLAKNAFDKFDASVLGLGDLTAPARSLDSLAAVFDLEGFTNFCKQIEPHLSVPLFLSSFLEWMLERLRSEMCRNTHDEGIELWCPLPYFVKFMGDGLLVLWDSSGMSHVSRRNVVASCHEIRTAYRDEFFPSIRSKVAESPPNLRCGIARGTVFSVGNGEDYVGSCINMASRIQKLPGLSFAFNRRGFELDGESVNPFFKDTFVIKEISIRGIGDHELLCIYKSEFEALSEADRSAWDDV